jgi:6-phospho-beta-glucosidase
VLHIADRVRELAAPDAWIVDFTNPVGIVTRALLDHGHRAIGLCNVAIGLQRWAARLLEVDPGRVLVDQVGLNHLTWVRTLRVDGEDVLPRLLAERGAEVAAHVGLREALVGELGVIPSYYLRYFYCHDEVVAQLRDAEPRAAVVAALERELLVQYADPTVDEKPVLLERRGGAFYSEAATALIASLTAGTGDVQVVDVYNGSTLAGLAPDDVVEVPAKIGREGAEPLPQPPLAPELLGLAQHVAAYERLTAAAAVTRDPVTARKALLTHPLIGQDLVTDDLLEGLIAAERRRGGELVQA